MIFLTVRRCEAISLQPVRQIAATVAGTKKGGAVPGEALVSAVEALRARPAAGAGAAAPDAAAVVARLTGALRDHDTRFLDDYLVVLVSHGDAGVKAITDELIRNVEGASSSGGGAGGVDGGSGVVLACWLAAATAWRAPRPPSAPRALLALLADLEPPQVERVARALHGAMGARELLVASDALRGAAARFRGGVGAGAGATTALAWALAGREGLAALLLRGALGALLGAPVAWQAGPLAVDELGVALASRWDALDAEAQLTGAALAARVVSGAAAAGAAAEGPAAARLLAALAHPPPPALRHHPEYLKTTIALGRLQKLFGPAPAAPATPNGPN